MSTRRTGVRGRRASINDVEEPQPKQLFHNLTNKARSLEPSPSYALTIAAPKPSYSCYSLGDTCCSLLRLFRESSCISKYQISVDLVLDLETCHQVYRLEHYVSRTE